MGEVVDYLIISDLHLRGGFHNPTAGLYHFDEEFADFLRHYRVHRDTGRPWRLIIGGDLIEFLFITDPPDPGEPLLRGATFSEGERRYGAGTEAQKSRWKLDVILRSSHPQLLLAMARFIAAGNEILVLRGNHDIELAWPQVQEHFRRLIAEHHPADVGYMRMKELVGTRVQFPLWFWYTPGLLYAEHGCQYDPFCSTEHVLNPVVPEAPTRLQLSIADFSIRYFANQMKMINALAAENVMSVSEYIGWVVGRNLPLLPRIARLYAEMVRRVLAKSGHPDAAAEAAVRTEHDRRVAAFDDRYGLSPGTAARVNAMHATPVMRRPLATARFLALDLIAAGLLIVAAAVGVLVWAPTRGGLLASLAVFAAVGLVAYVGSLRFRRVSEAAGLRRTAERIAELFQVRYVAFGHTHAAGTWQLPNGATYVNVGTWVPGGDEAYFVYFAIDGATRDGALWRWNKREMKPERFG
jgi:UDP-2,3-diacylglucosamine pyrophosphatase LpxH